MLTRVAKAAIAGWDCNIIIIGGGATGVELAAAIREVDTVYAAYGYLSPSQHLHVTLIEGAARILAPLPYQCL